MSSSTGEVSACSIPATSEPNRTGEGRCRTANRRLASTVTTSTPSQRRAVSVRGLIACQPRSAAPLLEPCNDSVRRTDLDFVRGAGFWEDGLVGGEYSFA